METVTGAWIEIELPLFKKLAAFVKDARNYVRGGFISHDVSGAESYVVRRDGREICVLETYLIDGYKRYYRVEPETYKRYQEICGYDA